MRNSQSQLSSAVDVVRAAIGDRQPGVGLILGSGLGVIADAAENRVVIKYGDIPGFHVSHVEGHAGQLVIGDVGDVTVMIMQGRFHYYEGVSMEEIAFPIELMRKLGVGSVIITSASGGVNSQLKKGDIMLLDDHINFVFRNPFRGAIKTSDHNLALKGGNRVWEISPASEGDNRAWEISSEAKDGRTAEMWHLPKVNDVYSIKLKELAFDIAGEENVDLKKGVYLMVEGPSYETKAEIKMVRKLGGDVVGMSTVPEALAAHSIGMSVLGITYVSNMASGLAPGPLVHSHVIETMEMIRDDMTKLITGIIKKIEKAI